MPLQIVQRRPAAAPVDDFTHPAQVQPSPLGELAKALGGLAPSLQKFADVQNAQRVADPTNDVRAEVRLNGLSFAEARSLRDEGKLAPDADPWFQAALEKAYGARYAVWQKEQATEEYMRSPNREVMDIDQFISQHLTPEDSVLNSRFAAAGYSATVGDFANKLRVQQSTERGQFKVEQARASFYDFARQTVMRGIDGNEPPEKIISRVRDLYPSFGAQLRLSNGDMDESVMALATELARDTGRADVVEGLLLRERTGADGVLIPSIAAKSGKTAHAYQIVEAARNTETEHLRAVSGEEVFALTKAAHNGELTADHDSRAQGLIALKVLTPEQWNSMRLVNDNAIKTAQHAATTAQRRQQVQQVKDGAVNQTVVSIYGGQAGDVRDFTFDDENGSRVTMTRDKLLETATGRIIDGIEQAGAEQDAPIEAIRAQQAHVLQQNGLISARFKDVLQAGYTAASLTAGRWVKQGNGQEKLTLPQPVVEGYTLWKQLGANGVTLQSSHAPSGDVSRFYSLAETYERYLNADQTTALGFAADALAPAKAGMLQDRDFIDRAVREAKGLLDRGFFSSGAQNDSDVAAELMNLTRANIGLGIGPKEALQAAKTQYEKSHTIINGWMVNTGNQNLPPAEDLRNYIDAALDDAVENAKGSETELDKDDLVVRPTTEKADCWVISYKDVLKGFLAVKGFLTIDDMRKLYNKRQADRINRKDTDSGVSWQAPFG